MRRYFLTGCTGFVGRAIVRELCKRADTEAIWLLTRKPQARYEMLSWDKRIVLCEGEITTCDFPSGEFTDLIHGANEANDLLQPDQAAYYYTIVEGTSRVLQWAAHNGIERQLVLSSGAALRDTVYGRAKRQCERIAQEYHLHTKIARIYALVGEEMPLNGQYAIGKFVHMALHDGKVRYYGGQSERTYLHVNDCAWWLLDILERGKHFVPYDVAGNERVTMAELAWRVGIAFGVPVEKIDGPDRVDTYLPDLTAATTLGLKQTISLTHALERYRDAVKFRNSDLQPPAAA